MAKTELDAARVRELFNYDSATGVLTNRIYRSPNALRGDVVGTPDKKGYLTVSIGGHQYFCHRIAFLHYHGRWPAGLLDHRDRVKSHNWIDNLREADKSINSQNVVEPNACNAMGLIGVSPHNSGFRAQLRVNGKFVLRRTFRTQEEASAAYWEAKRQYHHGYHQAR